METITLKEAPELRSVLSLIGYRKHKCFVSVFPNSGVGINSYWSGGSRSEFNLVDLSTNRSIPLPTNTHPYFDVARNTGPGETEAINIDHVGNITLKFIPENVCLIKHGTFCGKPATAHIYFHPNNLTKLLR